MIENITMCDEYTMSFINDTSKPYLKIESICGEIIDRFPISLAAVH